MGTSTMMARARTAVLLLPLVLAGGVVAACGEDGPDARVTRPATALVVGDSILHQSTEEVRAELEAAGWTAVIEAHGGANLLRGIGVPSWPDLLARRVAEANPDVVVVELGTNGCAPCESFDTAIDRVMEPLREIGRVYWVNVKEVGPIPERPGPLNEALEDATDRWDNLEVLDMDERFSGDPDLVLRRNPHLTRRGEQAFAEFVVDALPDAPGR
jgi:hypothetical protein